MVTEHQREQEERKRVTLQDVDLRRQQQERERAERGLNTYAAFAQADIETPGRHGVAQTTPPRVIGATPNIAAAYPAASAAHQTELPPELPTGHDINEMPPLEPSTVHASVEATGPASADAPLLSDSASLSDVQRAGAGPSFSQTETRLGGPARASHLPPGPARTRRDAGSPSSTTDDEGSDA
jgi:hypothetical protein